MLKLEINRGILSSSFDVIYISYTQNRCRKCQGSKTTKAKKKISFDIKKGMVNGHKIRLQGEGDEVVSCCLMTVNSVYSP